MPPEHDIDSSLFKALQEVELDSLLGRDLSCVLPILTNLLLSPSFLNKRKLFHILYSNRKTNSIIRLLTLKNCDIIESPKPAYLFEAASWADKLKLVSCEFLRIQDYARQSALSSSSESKLLLSELFDNPIYVEDVSYCLCCLLIKPFSVQAINLIDMAEALLYVKYGTTYIVRLVANIPDRCLEVCHALISRGEALDEAANFSDVSDQRARSLRELCAICPSIAFSVRSATLQCCRMPSLTVMITSDYLDKALSNYTASLAAEPLDDIHLAGAFEELKDCYDNAIAFITGILLGADDGTRTWFSQYTKAAQQKRIDLSHQSILSTIRSQLITCMKYLFKSILNQEQNDISDSPSTDQKIPRAKAKLNNSLVPSNKDLIMATATLRLFCALKGIGSLKLNNDETDVLLKLITSRPPVDQTSVNFVTTGVCALLVCPPPSNNQKEDKRAADWLKWLIKDSDYSNGQHSSHGKCSISELLLLFAIHFQNNQTTQIAELVCATLGMKLQIKASVSKCKNLFVQEVFNDQMVAEHAVKVPVTKGLNNHITEFIPVHCIHQLLESRSFSKHQVSIKDWIYRQICESKKPIHNILPKLIEAYVNSVIISTSAQGNCGTNQPISEEDIAKVFKRKLYSIALSDEDDSVSINGEERMQISKGGHRLTNGVHKDEEEELEIIDYEASQVLLLYYLVLYEDIRLKKSPDMSAAERAKLTRYNPDFMLEIPVFYLLQLVRDNQNSFSAILPDILKLVTSQYPQLCSTQHWLNIDQYGKEKAESNGIIVHKVKANPLDELKNLIQKKPQKKSSTNQSLLNQLVAQFEHFQSISSLTHIINQILLLPNEGIWPFVNAFIDNLAQIIKLDVTDEPAICKLMKASANLWWKFNSICPRKLWVMTVNALRRPQNSTIEVKPVGYSWDELVSDPLIVLRCDPRVLRSVEMLNILLHILAAFLASSRRSLQDQISEVPRQKDVRNLEELRVTLIHAQTSAAIQILLESCIPSECEDDALVKRERKVVLTSQDEFILKRYDSSVDCICEHLHQVFIADTNLAKLVHFQTYPSELLAMTSDKIPSMHICLDFIPELLAQPDLTKQVFVIELTSHLCEKYAITKSLNVAKLCFNVAFTLLQLLPSQRRALFFIPVLPALLRICCVFPILREDVETILNQINQITLAHMASTSSRLSLGSSNPFDGLDSLSWRETMSLMKTSMSADEALYLCIQKCQVETSRLKLTNARGVFIDELQKQHHLQPVYSSIFAYGNHVMNPSGV